VFVHEHMTDRMLLHAHLYEPNINLDKAHEIEQVETRLTFIILMNRHRSRVIWLLIYPIMTSADTL
jgi:hypothetical protein